MAFPFFTSLKKKMFNDYIKISRSSKAYLDLECTRCGCQDRKSLRIINSIIEDWRGGSGHD